MIVALDVGERRIGIAVSDPTESYALPLRTLERTTLHEDLSAIVAVARDYAAATIVVGDPIALSGQRTLASHKMDAFVATLARAYGGTIERIDERLTTAQATRTLVALELSRKERKRVVDQLAAALILDAFLARKQRNGR